MLQKKTFQIIFNEVSKCLPQNWKRVVIYIEYGEDAYSYAFYAKVNGQYINGYNLPGASEQQIAESFRTIDKAILKERNESADRLWTNMTMIVDDDGTMHTDFDYSDLSTGAYKYKKQWKAKYLR